MSSQQTDLSTSEPLYPKYRPDIDGLRAVAVLSVVGYHASPFWIKGGFVGVDIFFVISGFLISTIIYENLQRGIFSFVEFYGRRIRRIFPALFVVLVASLVAGWFELIPNDFKQLGKHVAGGTAFISNFILWRESGYFDNAADTKPLLHLWSLGIEEQFYILWPLLLWAGWKKKLNLLALTIGIAASSFALNIAVARADPVADFYSPLTRFWELLIGALLANYALNGSNGFVSKARRTLDTLLGRIIYAKVPDSNGDNLRDFESVFGAVLIAVALLIINRERHYPFTWALLPTLGAAFIISSGPRAWFNRTVLSNSFLVWCGLISFPLYLWHWPLLSFAKSIEGETPATSLKIAIVVVSIFLAWLTYRFIERPIRNGKWSKLKTIIAAIFMGLVGGVGLYISNGGFARLLPGTVSEMVDHDYHATEAYRLGNCFLSPDRDWTHFADCGVTRDKAKKTILIWGDSHAAHLYPGYQTVFGSKYNIIQRTAASCPPILNREQPDNKFCKELNDKTFELIRKENPDIVVLSALWVGYPENDAVVETIHKLREIGVKNIDLVGPDPLWDVKLGLPRILYNYFQKFGNVPRRMVFGLQPNTVDSKIRKLAEDENVRYISPYDILCSKEGCLTRVDDDDMNSLVSWDANHFTPVGSIYVVSRFPSNWEH